MKLRDMIDNVLINIFAYIMGILFVKPMLKEIYKITNERTKGLRDI